MNVLYTYKGWSVAKGKHEDRITFMLCPKGHIYAYDLSYKKASCTDHDCPIPLTLEVFKQLFAVINCIRVMEGHSKMEPWRDLDEPI